MYYKTALRHTNYIMSSLYHVVVKKVACLIFDSSRFCLIDLLILLYN